MTKQKKFVQSAEVVETSTKITFKKANSLEISSGRDLATYKLAYETTILFDYEQQGNENNNRIKPISKFSV